MLPFIYKSTDNMMIQLLKQMDAGYSTDRGEILLFLPFLIAVVLLGWGVSAIVRRIRNGKVKVFVGVTLSAVLVFITLMVFSYVSFVATLTVPQPYNTITSPSGAHRVVVLRGLSDDEDRVQARHDARLEVDPESGEDVVAEDWCYRYTAYPTAGAFFYRDDANVEGEVSIGYGAGGGTLMVEWNDGEQEAQFFVQDPGPGEGGDLYVRF